MVSIHEVAKHAGVSVATVSKVINNYSDVSSKTRIKVNKAIELLNYQPNVVARSLVKKRSWTVGMFLLDYFSNPFIAELVDGLRKSLEDSGYDLLFLSPNLSNPDYTFTKHCLSRNVDGVVMFGVDRNNQNLLDLLQAEMPTMMIDTDLLGPRTGYVTADNSQGANLAVQHLVKLGHKRIAFISGDLGCLVGQTRFTGYQQGLRSSNLPYYAKYVEVEDYSIEGGYNAMKRLLQLPEAPSGVICSSDYMATGAIEAIRESGMQVPEHISVVGFDNTFYAELSKPKLTTVNQNIASMGMRAGEHLIRMIENPDYSPPTEIVPVDLVVRDSTGVYMEQQ
ncbi:LacI family DNA-binding transcriptional regulator [Paenibacillus sp. HN-1]|uniref:LacI family DNA-binding transcriptional regulator n=1 Tax=Paenibacillus TaxID=44249 RepID=UPI001CA8A456|nr:MULTISPECIES: LacI family DNA-binding transcriptional regulator [Paenibacillus]MBY9079364.1 LacI family DNA-binding transcriptional regulator [Paenibacillus sp. CGMCC 1.18879]MBY9084117.1 LacI family DNA-binding transcriptional regulator [Paenibacillus sinensis]